jgi:hypothetical protein
MEVQQMINQVKRLYDEVFMKGNFNVCDEICAASIQINDPAYLAK